MRSNNPKWLAIHANIRDYCASWLQSGQGHGARLLHFGAAQQEQISMPAMRPRAQAIRQNDRIQPCLAVQHLRIKYAPSITKAAIHLLKGDNIRTQLGDDLNGSCGITP